MNLRKVTALSLIGLSVLGTNTVNAEVNQTQEKSETTTAKCEVYYELGSTYTVSIPKKITLENDKTAVYTVTVSGDIASNKVVRVVPDTTFIMEDISSSTNAKSDVTATITQSYKEWTWSEVEKNAQKLGKVSAPGLSAGKWTGTFNFNISFENVK